MAYRTVLIHQGVLKADPVAVQELRRQVLDDLEEVREEIEELLEVKVGHPCIYIRPPDPSTCVCYFP